MQGCHASKVKKKLQILGNKALLTVYLSFIFICLSLIYLLFYLQPIIACQNSGSNKHLSSIGLNECKIESLPILIFGQVPEMFSGTSFKYFKVKMRCVLGGKWAVWVLKTAALLKCFFVLLNPDVSG